MLTCRTEDGARACALDVQRLQDRRHLDDLWAGADDGEHRDHGRARGTAPTLPRRHPWLRPWSCSRERVRKLAPRARFNARSPAKLHESAAPTDNSGMTA